MSTMLQSSEVSFALHDGISWVLLWSLVEVPGLHSPDRRSHYVVHTGLEYSGPRNPTS